MAQCSYVYLLKPFLIYIIASWIVSLYSAYPRPAHSVHCSAVHHGWPRLALLTIFQRKSKSFRWPGPWNEKVTILTPRICIRTIMVVIVLTNLLRIDHKHFFYSSLDKVVGQKHALRRKPSFFVFKKKFPTKCLSSWAPRSA